MPEITLLNVDCMIYMNGLPDKSFDLAIVDPEYGIGEDGEKSHSRKGIAAAKKYAIKKWDTKRPDKIYFDELFRVSKNQIIWGFNYFSDLLPATNSIVIWDKKCHDKYSTDMSDAEIAWCSIGNRASIFRFLWSGMMQGSEANGSEFVGDLSKKEMRIHPTQKPVKLYKWLLQNYAKPVCNNKHTEEYKSLCTDCNKPFRILDTHLGSGSSAIAAHSMGFDFVGCELDKDYYDAACKRFKEQTMQQKLFI